VAEPLSRAFHGGPLPAGADIQALLPQGAVSCVSTLTSSWTPCSERMPDQWQHCLVSSEFRGIQVARWDGRKWISIAQLPAALVSHWMPLPAAPEVQT